MNSVASCAPASTENFTVGQEQLFKCALDEAQQTEIQKWGVEKLNIAPAQKNPPYVFVPIGPARLNGGVLEIPFTSYQVGSHQDVAVQLQLGDKIVPTTPFGFTVVSVIQHQNGDKNDPQPYPIFDPQSIAVPLWWWLLWIAVGTLVTGLLGYKAWSWVKTKKAQKTEKIQHQILLPREKYQKDILELQGQGLHHGGDYKAFALTLTALVKKAIGKEFSFPAEDMTTEEFFEALRSHQPFYQDARTALQNLLSDLDKIKFAKVESSPHECEGLIHIAQNLGHLLYGRTP